jgi:hypothetical protein
MRLLLSEAEKTERLQSRLVVFGTQVIYEQLGRWPLDVVVANSKVT